MPAERNGTLCGWGRIPRPGHEILSEDLAAITRDVPLSRGLGRSYGDSSLPPPGHPAVAGTRLADRILAFDPESGLLRAESGLSLADINRLFWPRRWSSPVLPGTQFVTLGGMVAADVHGKNHHVDGTFGRHVTRLHMRLADGTLCWCSRDDQPGLFRATLGGMGLTGHILEVEVRLQRIPSPWIWAESERVASLDGMLEGLAKAADRWPFTVGWIDVLQRGRAMGRGILFCARWAEPEEAPAVLPRRKLQLGVPVEMPGWVLDRWSVRLFNLGVYYRHVPWRRRGIMHPVSFFHPLDAVHHWNRIYGPRGMTQYQCVLPADGGPPAVRHFLELLTSFGVASFLTVIKDCGAEGEGLLSFPRAGTSIALDIPVRDDTQEVVDRLNQAVIAAGGRIYLAKDAFTRAEHFRAMDPRLDAWQTIRDRYDPGGQLASAQSVRILGDQA